MKEYWEITQERGVATLAVWYMDQNFELTGCSFNDHTTRVADMEGKATDRASAEADLSDARQATTDLFAKLDNLIVRVPGVIEGQLSPDDDLHGQLDLVYAVGMNVSQATSLRRARLVRGLWLDYNTAQTGHVPADPPLIMKYKKADSDDPEVSVTQANFGTLIDTCLAAQTAEANALRPVSNTKSALRTAERRVDRDNKRWYLAWTKFYPEGTAEGDAARSQVPTEQGTPPPNALEIATLVVHGDRTVTVNYPENGGEHATTLELLYKLPGDEEFGHTTPLTRPSQTVGPFAASITVTFMTRVANSTPGVVLSEPKSAVMPG